MLEDVYQKQLYCMEQANKKVNSSFLDKFRGKTNKIDKNGVNHALLSDKSNIQQPQSKNQSRTHPRKLISLDTKNTSIDLSSKRTQLQDKLYNNPQRKYMLPMMSKRSTNTNIYANKLMPISPLYSPPQIPSKQQKQTVQNPFILPPSRSISDKSQNNLPRTPFGKYLKLDEDAMKHFQFLLQLDKKRAQRKGSGVFSQR